MSLSTDPKVRKEQPMARGLLDYFPDALAAVSNVSLVGNRQHNPGQEMHWAREKSTDHADCIARHLADRGTFDSEGLRHSAKIAWRALAMLQIEIEEDAKKKGNDNRRDCKSVYQQQMEAEDEHYPPAGSGLPPYSPPTAAMQNLAELAKWHGVAGFEETESLSHYLRERDRQVLKRLHCAPHVAEQIVGGTSYAHKPAHAVAHYAYIAGPMRGLPADNFPEFDRIRDELLAKNVHVISPADIDRYAKDKHPSTKISTYAYRDYMALHFLSRLKEQGVDVSVVFLKGWESSVGAFEEFGVARMLGLDILNDRFFKMRMHDYCAAAVLNAIEKTLEGQ